ncbi:MAG: alpha-galactosidase [Myxococcales bacterium]|nr:MAG: alpha-galactosidase [Myxococcales bacterium]
MALAGGKRWLRFAGASGALFGVFGCGDAQLTAILTDPAPAASADQCAAGEGRGAGPLPPMGWNGWNTFGCGPDLDEAKFRATADALVQSGLRAAGYEYVNLDDCWQAGRAADGTIQVDPDRFPSGLAALGSYLHQNQLKFGIYSNVGDCVRPELTTPSSAGYESQDAASYASFGADYVKYNACGGTRGEVQSSFEAMRDALAQTGRPMLLSVVDAPFKPWHPEIGQLWRTHGEIEPTWEGIVATIDATTRLAAYAGQGGYNDSDMLWLGHEGLSETESRAYFSMWAALASPLLAGNDLTVMPEAVRVILTQPDLIAFNQDPLRLQAALVGTQGDVSVYAKPLAECGARAVVLLNRGDTSAMGSVTWAELGLNAGEAWVRNVWEGTKTLAADGLKPLLGPHEAVALRVVGSELPLPRGEVQLSDLTWTYATNGWGPVERDQEPGGTAEGDGGMLALDGREYAKGLGMNSPALVRYRLGKRCRELNADIGIDDATGDAGSVIFQVWADGDKLFDSGVVLGKDPARHITVDVTGRSELRLFVGEVEDFGQDHAAWADARLSCED